MNRSYDIICFSSSDWDGNWGSRQQVMRRFAARGHRVLYVEQMAGLEHLWRYPELRKRRRNRRSRGIDEIETNLWLHTPPALLPGRYYSRFVARMNAQVVAHDVLEQTERLGFERPILWMYLPEHAPLVGQFGERLCAYHCIDEWSVGARGRKRNTVVALERDLVQHAHIVFANSRLTYENKKRWNANTYRVPSGADVEHFSSARLGVAHPSVADLQHPVLAFAGNINEKINITLLTSVARAKPEWSIVLAGRHNPHAVDLSQLNALANIHMLGEVPFDVLPSVLAGADLCLLPYAVGEATRYRSPLKLYEYLATGKPIVSTPHPEVAEWSDFVTIAPTDEFTAAIERALANDTTEESNRRREVAKAQSWDSRVDTMEALLNENMK